MPKMCPGKNRNLQKQADEKSQKTEQVSIHGKLKQ